MYRFSTFAINDYDNLKKSIKMSSKTVVQLDELKDLTLRPEDIVSDKILDAKRDAALDCLN